MIILTILLACFLRHGVQQKVTKQGSQKLALAVPLVVQLSIACITTYVVARITT